MDIQFYGANCVVLSGKGVRIVVDDNLQELGAKSVAKQGDILLFTRTHAAPAGGARLCIDGPGEYEVSDLSVIGVAARAHMDEQGMHTATMYRVMADGVTYMFAGHVYPDLSDDQLETVGMVDVLFVPVGGNGYTLDAAGALKLIKAIEPKLVIPTHYADPALKYPVPQQSLEQALKTMSMEPKETVAKLRYKPSEIAGATQLIVVSHG